MSTCWCLLSAHLSSQHFSSQHFPSQNFSSQHFSSKDFPSQHFSQYFPPSNSLLVASSKHSPPVYPVPLSSQHHSSPSITLLVPTISHHVLPSAPSSRHPLFPEFHSSKHRLPPTGIRTYCESRHMSELYYKLQDSDRCLFLLCISILVSCIRALVI